MFSLVLSLFLVFGLHTMDVGTGPVGSPPAVSPADAGTGPTGSPQGISHPQFRLLDAGIGPTG